MRLINKKPRMTKRQAFGIAAGATGAAALILASHPAACAQALAITANVVTCATTSACIGGANTSSGPGISGTSAKGVAITGSGTSGISGTGTSGYGISGKSTSGVGIEGVSSTGDGIKGNSTSSSGVYGESNTGFGVWGVSSSSSGVYAQTSGAGASAVWGASNSTSSSAIGVYGRASNGTGVSGTSTNGDGIVGSSAYGDGAYVSSSLGNALVAQSTYGTAAAAYTSAGGEALYAEADNPNGATAIVGNSPYGDPLELYGSGGNVVFYVDNSGNFYYAGTGYPFSAAQGGATVKSFTGTTTLPTVEDTGTGQLSAGTAAVMLDSAFAASIDTRTPYNVFITPDGDTRGLFVATKTARGFIVREAQGGSSSVSFDYRIVATARGATGQRMSFVDLRSMPRLNVRAPRKPNLPSVP
jgi:hypothetical protein